ncbi:MAG TPA: beta-ketoacyl synthase chain length factor [Candidatus Saccharimonadia bacterium]|nr:beta-ketoacyl synthase chain length factor [Candidatus Saccharimonadia bacterium]
MHPVTRACHLDGIALWTPSLPSHAHAVRVWRSEAGPADPPAPRPSPALLAPTERRRAPDTVAIALAVASDACAAAGADPATLPCVFASTEGDLVISDYMCRTLATEPREISPTRFHNSVHNAASGYWTIATGCHAPATSLSAWRETWAVGLLEALLQAEDAGRVLYVAYDIEAVGPMRTVCDSRGQFGTALVAARERSERSTHRIEWRTRERREGDELAPHAGLAAGNPLARALELHAAVAADTERIVCTPLSAGLTLELTVMPAGTP